MSKKAAKAVGFPPIANAESETLILGTLPSAQSIEKGEYYAHPQNHFWPIMETIFKIERSAPYKTRRAALLAHRIAVWDVLHSAERKGSSDTKIKGEEANEIHRLLKSHHRIKRIVFNGNNAYKIAKRISSEIVPSGRYTIYVVPSTSSRNARMSFKGKANRWKKVIGKGS